MYTGTHMYIYTLVNPGFIAQSAGAIKYTDCISAEGYNSPNECPKYDIKQYLVNAGHHFYCQHSQVHYAPGN